MTPEPMVPMSLLLDILQLLGEVKATTEITLLAVAGLEAQVSALPKTMLAPQTK